MNTIWILLAGIIGVAAIGKKSGGVGSVVNATLDRITKRITGFNLVLGLPNIGFEIKITFTNGNPLPVTINSFQGGLYFVDFKIEDIVLQQPFTMPANGSVEATFFVDVNITQIGQQFQAFISNGNFQGNLKVLGTAATNFGSFPVNEIVA